MKTIQMNRRQFVSGMAMAAGALVLVSCAPAAMNAVQSPSSTNEPLPGTDASQPTAADRQLKVLVVYDSVYGNTAKIAEAIITGIGAAHTSRIGKAGEISAADLEGIDLLIAGSPTHGGTYTEPVKNFFASIPSDRLNGVKAAAFDTSFTVESQGKFVRFLMKTFGYAAPKIADALSSKGAEVLTSEIFYVVDTEGPLKEGETERAGKWAAALLSQV